MDKRKHQVFITGTYIYSWLSIAIITAVCLFVILVVFWFGKDVISIDFLTMEPAASADELSNSGILTPLLGTLLLTLIGITLAFPFAIATALYMVYYSKCNFFGKLLESAIDVLAGIPTIVIALFARAMFTLPSLGFLSTMVENSDLTLSPERAYGKSFLVAGITMSIMILPYVIKSITTTFKSVPKGFYDASIGLGASKWHTLYSVILQASRPGIVTGTILGMGRIIGDTAIVWLALGGTLRMTGMQPWYAPHNWISTLQNTGSTLTSYIYYTSPVGEGNNYSVAFGAAIVLIIIIILLNTLAAFIGKSQFNGER